MTQPELLLFGLVVGIMIGYFFPMGQDNTRQFWGHAFENTRGDQYAGHGLGIKVGDHTLSKMQSGRVGRLKVVSIRYMRDPDDQWFALLELDGYEP